MPLGNCDCCGRRDVEGSIVDAPGEPFVCDDCQGEPVGPETDAEAVAAYERDLDVIRQCIERPL